MTHSKNKRTENKNKMNENQKRDSKIQKNPQKKRKNVFLITFICIFLALVLIFGAILGIISIVKNSKAAVKYEGLTMDTETASFFATYHKYRYMSILSSAGTLGVEDTKGFWNKIYDKEGVSYGELLKKSTEQYIRQIMAANYLYDNYARLSSDDRDIINTARRELLTYKADGNKELFNSSVSKYGFDYDSLKDAITMLYKANAAKNMIYGADGSNLKNFPDLANEYLSEYTHVKLLFIRTETTFVLDAGGNRIVGDDGNDQTRLLTDAEKAERQKLISDIRGYIEAEKNGGDIQMGEEMFNFYLENNDEGDKNMHADGYYFHKNSAFTAEFSEVFKNIVDKSYVMEMNSYGEVSVDFGVCFIYKYEPTANVYASTLAEPCFTDFYSDAAAVIFEKTLTELSFDVVFTEKFNKIDIIELPYNYDYLPSF